MVDARTVRSPSGGVHGWTSSTRSAVHRQPVTIPADALAGRGDAYWAELIANPTFAVYRGIRY